MFKSKLVCNSNQNREFLLVRELFVAQPRAELLLALRVLDLAPCGEKRLQSFVPQLGLCQDARKKSAKK